MMNYKKKPKYEPGFALFSGGGGGDTRFGMVVLLGHRPSRTSSPSRPPLGALINTAGFVCACLRLCTGGSHLTDFYSYWAVLDETTDESP